MRRLILPFMLGVVVGCPGDDGSSTDTAAASSGATSIGTPTGGAGCPAGVPDECDGSCVELMSDPDNCGGCGNQCPPTAGCIDGQCEAPCQDGGGSLCGATCVDLSSDQNNCGMCGNACVGLQLCVGGSCEDAQGGSGSDSGGSSGGADSTGGSSTGA